VLTIKSECLNRAVPLGERHLQHVISEFVDHYHRQRNHPGLENLLIDGAPQPANTNGRVLRRERLGGLLNYYHRKAA
jgi:putative transposase